MNNSKGFTLIELLSVITILAVILLIAIPMVLDTVTTTKNAAYNSQIKMIVAATKNYSTAFSLYPAVGEQQVVTLKDLQDNKFISTDLKDPRTGSIIPDGTWITITNNNGKYEYDYGYSSEGLILHYDSIYGDGLGLPNDNGNINKAIWKDLSGFNRNGTLFGFDYNAASGWTGNSLKFDGINDFVRTASLGTLNSLTFELVLVLNVQSQVTWTYGNDTLIVYSGGSAYIKSDTGNLATGLTLPMVNGTTYLMTIVYDLNSNKAYYYLNGSQTAQVSLPANSSSFSFANGQHIFADYNATAGFGFGNGNVYSVRFYNRALSNNEISSNYQVDKKRFNF